MHLLPSKPRTSLGARSPPSATARMHGAHSATAAATMIVPAAAAHEHMITVVAAFLIPELADLI